MPMPVSRTSNTTRPRSGRTRTATAPPGWLYSTALVSRFISTSRSLSGSVVSRVHRQPEAALGDAADGLGQVMDRPYPAAGQPPPAGGHGGEGDRPDQAQLGPQLGHSLEGFGRDLGLIGGPLLVVLGEEGV